MYIGTLFQRTFEYSMSAVNLRVLLGPFYLDQVVVELEGLFSVSSPRGMTLKL